MEKPKIKAEVIEMSETMYVGRRSSIMGGLEVRGQIFWSVRGVERSEVRGYKEVRGHEESKLMASPGHRNLHVR
jgi:hypothetical protein